MNINDDLHKVQFQDGREWVISRNGILYGAPAEIMAWTNAELGESGPPPITTAAMGILKRGFDKESIKNPEWLEEHLLELLVGGVYFFDDKWADIEVCVVIRDTMVTNDPAAIREILAYPFVQLKKNRITLRMAVANQDAIDAAEGLGCELECIRAKAGPMGDDVAQYYLTPELISDRISQEAA